MERARLPRLQRNSLEPLQPLGRLGHGDRRHSDVDLSYFCPSDRTGVGDITGDRQGFVWIGAERSYSRRDRKVLKREGGVREPEAEGEERLQVVRVIIAITHFYAFRIGLNVVDAGILRGRVRRNLRITHRQGNRKFSRGIEVAKEDRSHRLTVFRSWLPAFPNRQHTVYPRHQNRRSD